MKGFELPYKRKTVFVETDRVNKTQKLAKEIIIALNKQHGTDIPDHPDVMRDVLHYMRKAEMETSKLSNGNTLYKIKGDGFGMVCFDEDVMIVNLNN